MFKKGLIIMIILLVGLFIIGCGSPEQTSVQKDKKDEKITLRYAHFVPKGNIIDQEIERFARQVEERTGGRVKIETFPAGTLLPLPNMYDGVLQGIADIGFGQPGVEPNRFPLLTLLELPLGFTHSKIATQVGIDLIKEFEHDFLKDFKVINYFGSPTVTILTRGEVKSLQDLHGLELRSAGATSSSLKALGAVPISMGFPEMVEALQTGVIEGLIGGYTLARDFNLVGHLKHVVDYPLVSISQVALMDIEAWENLPADVQQVIEDVGSEMNRSLAINTAKDNQEALGWMKEKGVKVTALSPEEKTKWDAAVKPVIETRVKELEAKGLPAREFLKRIYELKEKYEKEFSL